MRRVAARRRAAPSLAALLVLAGCGSSSSNERSVDCVGMDVTSLVWNTSVTPLLAYDVASGSLTSRCTLLHGPMTGTTATLVGGASVLELGSTPDIAVLRVVADGALFQSLGGTLEFDAYAWDKASGTYRFQGQGYDMATGEVSSALTDLSGAFDWCDYSNRNDCPYEFEDTLSQEVTLSTPYLSETHAKASDCRMLVDTATGALQVDMQIGIWDGKNVAQLWTNECGYSVAVPPPANLFRFRAGGVTGPGRYGPVASRSFPGQRLPELAWTQPMVFLDGLNATTACSLYFSTATTSMSDDSACTFTVDDSGRFAADCSQVRHLSPPGVVSFDETGDFHIDMDCTYLER